MKGKTTGKNKEEGVGPSGERDSQKSSKEEGRGELYWWDANNCQGRKEKGWGGAEGIQDDQGKYRYGGDFLERRPLT